VNQQLLKKLWHDDRRTFDQVGFGHQPKSAHVAVAMIALYMHSCAAAPLALGEATTGYAKGMHESFNGS
jgi:hypothetical protein